MKLEEKKLTVLGGLGEKTYSAKISEEDIGKLWELIQAPYKNPIESLIRESCSNSIDAHTEAGVDDAVIVRLGKDETSYYISFIDVGVGMSEDRIENIYINYLKSTKTTSNEQLGAFGMGSKSPLSYNDYFFITTRYNGIERRLMMRKGEVKPELDVLEVIEATERNGTEIRVDIKSSYDFELFIQGCYNQLRYFPNVVFDFTNTKQLISSYGTLINYVNCLENDYNLIHGKTFVYGDGNTSGYNKPDLHLLLGNVIYPIDFSILGISRVNINVGLKFEIGELPVIQTREDIRYTEDAKKLIVQRIEEFKEECLERLETKEVEANDLSEFSTLCNESNYINIGTINPLKINVDDLVSDVKINDKKKPIQLKDFDYNFKSFDESYLFKILYSSSMYRTQAISFACTKKFSADGKVIKNSSGAIDSWRINAFYNEAIDDILEKVYRFKLDPYFPQYILNEKNEFNGKTNKYLYDKLNYYSSYFIRNVKVNIAKPLFIIARKEGVNKDITKALIKYSYAKFKEVYSSMTKYQDIKVDEAWWKDILEKKKANKNIVQYDRSKISIETTYKLHGGKPSYDRTGYRPTIQEFLNDSKKLDYNILIHKDDKEKYTSTAHSSSTEFEGLMSYIACYLDKKVQINITADRNYNKILNLRPEVNNIFTVEEFMKNKKIKTKVLGKVATLFKMKEYLDVADITNDSGNFYSNNTLRRVVNEIMNPVFVKDYNTIYNYMQSLSQYYYMSKYMSELMLDFNQLDNLTEIYDKELLQMFYKNVKLFTEHDLCFNHTNSKLPLYYFLTKFKPTEMYYSLNPKWYLLDSILLKEIDTSLKDTTINKLCRNSELNSSYSYPSITRLKEFKYLNNILKEKLVKLEN